MGGRKTTGKHVCEGKEDKNSRLGCVDSGNERTLPAFQQTNKEKWKLEEPSGKHKEEIQTAKELLESTLRGKKTKAEGWNVWNR